MFFEHLFFNHFRIVFSVTLEIYILFVTCIYLYLISFEPLYLCCSVCFRCDPHNCQFECEFEEGPQKRNITSLNSSPHPISFWLSVFADVHMNKYFMLNVAKHTFVLQQQIMSQFWCSICSVTRKVKICLNGIQKPNIVYYYKKLQLQQIILKNFWMKFISLLKQKLIIHVTFCGFSKIIFLSVYLSICLYCLVCWHFFLK